MGLGKLSLGWTKIECLCPAKTRFHPEGSKASLKGEIGVFVLERSFE